MAWPATALRHEVRHEACNHETRFKLQPATLPRTSPKHLDSPSIPGTLMPGSFVFKPWSSQTWVLYILAVGVAGKPSLRAFCCEPETIQLHISAAQMWNRKHSKLKRNSEPSSRTCHMLSPNSLGHHFNQLCFLEYSTLFNKI